MTEQKFREAVSRAEQIGTDVFATAQQIAGGLFLLGGNVNGGERTGAIEHGELARIPTVGLNPIASAPRDERRRDHLARNVARLQRALQLKAARPGFVATAEGALAAQTREELENRRTIRRQRMQRGCPM